ncbi:hypothetical protein J4H92_08180 [Leucobacter weissii]|uniref:Uncharacterized protein n=1 Tax=Leucobacter weissii TaxID=1983706 RepID=A0A939MRZ5_9MICO|nr:hypothetical protein [Leucobacter weissii]MBO1901924.1 hypothetical protein [Leucobacter weissii]
MSEQEADRPLTRRERRLRGLGVEAETAPPVAEQQPTAEAAAAAAPGPGDDAGIEISPLDEHGRPRTRREIRQLREQLLAERGAAAPPAQEAPTQAAEAEQGPESVADEFDPRLAETQAFTVQESREAEAAAPPAAKPTADDPSAGPLPAPSEPPQDSPATAAEPPVGEPPAQPVDGAAQADDGTVRPDGAPKQERGYSFPDIAPLEENVSVFDDPGGRAAAAGGAESPGAFDDLISRAVAQEGAAASTNSSALILPNLPETTGLSGPLGETGELFVTGSIELPKSLGETGGHTALHDSVELHPDSDDDEAEVVPAGGIAPVSAARAVSARVTEGQVVAKTTKEKSKVPLALILTGGGLVLGVGALLAWAASSGLFG